MGFLITVAKAFINCSTLESTVLNILKENFASKRVHRDNNNAGEEYVIAKGKEHW